MQTQKQLLVTEEDNMCIPETKDEAPVILTEGLNQMSFKQPKTKNTAANIHRIK